MIFITGGTGKVGTELVRELQACGADFTALAHSERSAAALAEQGMRVVRGDVTQPDTLPLHNAEKLFLLTSGLPNQTQVENALIDAAGRAGVRHIVKLSVYGAGPGVTALRQHGETEDYLRASGMAYTMLRPNSFMQNLPNTDGYTIQHQHAIYAPTGNGRVSFVDVRDVAEVAAIALTQPGHEKQTYSLTGPEALSWGDLAARFSAHLGTPIQFVDIPSEAFRQNLMGVGVPEFYATMLQELFQLYHDDVASPVTHDIERVTGHPARAMEDYLRENIHLFRAPEPIPV